jgi:hypothetical protein
MTLSNVEYACLRRAEDITKSTDIHFSDALDVDGEDERAKARSMMMRTLDRRSLTAVLGCMSYLRKVHGTGYELYLRNMKKKPKVCPVIW